MGKWVKAAIIIIAILFIVYVSGSIFYWSYNIVTAISNIHVRLVNVENQLQLKKDNDNERKTETESK